MIDQRFSAQPVIFYLIANTSPFEETVWVVASRLLSFGQL